MLTLMCSIDNWLEMKLWAFSISHCSQNELAPKLNVLHCLPRFLCQWNVVPFRGLKTLLATLMHAFIPQNNLHCRGHIKT